MKKPSKPSKPHWEMTTEELREATKEFDRPIPLSKTRPLTKQERVRWERSKRQPSRSVFILSGGKGTREPVLIQLDGDLLRRMDAYARSKKLTRAEVIEKGIRNVLSFVEDPHFGNRSRKSA
jgi:hypothetical protein